MKIKYKTITRKKGEYLVGDIVVVNHCGSYIPSGIFASSYSKDWKTFVAKITNYKKPLSLEELQHFIPSIGTVCYDHYTTFDNMAVFSEDSSLVSRESCIKRLATPKEIREYENKLRN